MNQKKASIPETEEPTPGHFAAIGEVMNLNRKVQIAFSKRAQRKHSLSARRGSEIFLGKEVMNQMAKDQKLKEQRTRDAVMIKGGKRTYFVDIQKSKAGKAYLKLSESRFRGEGEERERGEIIVFPEHAGQFAMAVLKQVLKLS